MTQFVPVIDHDRAEWRRLAQHAAGRKAHALADRLNNAAAQTSLPIAEFDNLQRIYRNWLVFGEH